jgi:deoxyribose-phosphate aldolase
MNLPSFIDHTYLKPDCTNEDIRRICQEAIEHKFFAVCIPPFFVQDAFRILENEPVKTATVIGFPMGYSSTAAKVEEIKRAIDEGVDELDVVVNLCALKSGNWNYVRNDIETVTRSAHLRGKGIKIILETGLLNADELEKLIDLCNKAEPDFIKTSTGFNAEGARPEIVAKMKELANDNIRIKASGGIRTKQDAMNMIEAGAHRLGTSSSLLIVQ